MKISKTLKPYFAACLVKRIGRFLEGRAGVRDVPEDVSVFDFEIGFLFDWLNRKQAQHSSAGGLRRWSLGVVLKEGDIDVAIVLRRGVIIKPLNTCIPAFLETLKLVERLERGEEKDMTCWLCLDDLGKDGHMALVDHFCCGHYVCLECKASVSTLTKCGMCRAPAPKFENLKSELLREAKKMRRRAMPEHDKEVIADVDRITEGIEGS